MNDSALQNTIRIGTVSSVDAAARTARVMFRDKGGHTSPALKIIQRPPPVTVEETTLTYDGTTEAHTHNANNQDWIPAVGALVLCVFLPNGDGDGFVIGGI